MAPGGPSPRPDTPFLTVGVALVLLVALLLSSFSGVRPAVLPSVPGSTAPSSTVSAAGVSGPLETLTQSPTAPLPGAKAVAVPVPLAERLPVLITLRYRDTSGLTTLLAGLTNPLSPLYHHYLTAAEFDAEYSPSETSYASLQSYLAGFGATDFTPFSDRTSLAFVATASSLEAMFHVSFAVYTRGSGDFLATSGAPRLPASLAAGVLQVEGLDTDPALGGQAVSGLAPGPAGSSSARPGVSGYLPPVTAGAVQYEYAPDFQVAYDELGLFQQAGFPRNAVIATILWAGQYTGPGTSSPYGNLTNGEVLPPFVPGDVSSFYNETLPPGQPVPIARGVPINGAPEPGPLASWDGIGAAFENTLDLEMAGSTAPGARLYNIYGPTNSFLNLDEAFATALSPPSNESGLLNVSVISNSWVGQDVNDSSWYSSLEQAQARGITVLGCSGDSGDNVASPKWYGSQVSYPATMAYNDFGTVAVGGTTVGLSPALTVAQNIVWNISAVGGAGEGPAGSVGGISLAIPEPSWQLNSSANLLLQGRGRGVPDLSALANNTLITLTLEGYQYRATNASSGLPFYFAWGTSIATPLVAGLLADIDHVLASQSQPALGFLDPALYALANEQYAPLENYSSNGYSVTGAYNSSLPTRPLLPVVQGQNLVYSARYGYSLVAGWGSLQAYNFTMYEIATGDLPGSRGVFGVENVLDLNALNVTTTLPGSGGGGVNQEFNASVQQNLFLADPFGAPVYWVQNVIYVTWVPGAPNEFGLTFTGWVVYPFYGLYPTETVYEYALGATYVQHLPATFDVSTNLLPGTVPAIEFSVGSNSLALPVPGAASIIGSLIYPYSWDGQNYTNGPTPNNPGLGGLAPQFSLVGGPSYGIGNFRSPTAGSVTSRLRPFDSNTFVNASVTTFGTNVDQTGERASNLSWAAGAGGAWDLSASPGSTLQGILSYLPPSALYPVTFRETGLPAGAPWWVNVTGVGSFQGSGAAVELYMPNGTFTYSVAMGSSSYRPTPGGGSFSVDGSSFEGAVSFSPQTYQVTFRSVGLPGSVGWWLNGTGPPVVVQGGSETLALMNGTYLYTAVAENRSWRASPSQGYVGVLGADVNISVQFTPVLFPNVFTEQGLPAGSPWSVNVSGTYEIRGNSSNLTVDLSNGSYRYVIGAPSGYTAAPTNGSLRVEGASENVRVNMTKNPSGPSFLGGALVYVILGTGVALLVVLLVLGRSRRRRRPPPARPWSPPSPEAPEPVTSSPGVPPGGTG